MKYLILHGAGLADVAKGDLGGRTPLEAAATPALDRLAGHGELGAAMVPPEAAGWKGEALSLVMLGYDPAKHYQGPAPLEAAGLGVALGEHDVAFRCHIVSLRPTSHEGPSPPRAEVRKLGSHLTMDDPTAGGIDTESARELLDAVNEQLGSEAIQFYPGAGHRHVMVWVDGKARSICHPPHELVGKPVGEFLPTGDGSEILRQVMESSLVILRDHPLNVERRDEGLKPANCLWLWGQGRSPNLTKLTESRGLTGSVVTASDLARGVGIAAGLEPVDPADFVANGSADLSAQREMALRELRKHDVVYVQTALPDELANGSDAKAKLKAVEEFDRLLAGPLVEALASLGPHRVLVVCDYGHGAGVAEAPIPYVLYEGPVKGAGETRRLTEAAAAQGKARDAARLAARLLPKV